MSMTEGYLNYYHLQRLEIHLSDLDLEIDKASDSAPQFFTPFPKEHLEISSCAANRPEHTSLPDQAERKRYYSRDYDLGRSLYNALVCHLIDIRDIYPTKWENIEYE